MVSYRRRPSPLPDPHELARAVNQMVSYRRRPSPLPDPHELARAVNQMVSYRRRPSLLIQTADGISAVFSVTNSGAARCYRYRQAPRFLVPVVNRSVQQPSRCPADSFADVREPRRVYTCTAVRTHVRRRPALTGCGIAESSPRGLRAEPDTAPLEIAFSYQNNLAHLLQWDECGARGSTSVRSASTRCRRSGIVWRRGSSPSASPTSKLVGVGGGGARRGSSPSASPTSKLVGVGGVVSRRGSSPSGSPTSKLVGVGGVVSRRR